MLIGLDTDWLLMVLLGGLALNTILVFVVIVAFVRLGKRERASRGSVKVLHEDIGALCAGAVGVGRRLAAVEQTLRQHEERQDQFELRDARDHQAYEHAIKLAHKGMETHDLMETCALTRGEAELIMMLHRYREQEHVEPVKGSSAA